MLKNAKTWEEKTLISQFDHDAVSDHICLSQATQFSNWSQTNEYP